MGEPADYDWKLYEKTANSEPAFVLDTISPLEDDNKVTLLAF